jgi:hypothetical protein
VADRTLLHKMSHWKRIQNASVTLSKRFSIRFPRFFRPAAAHGVTQKPVPQINHGVLYILPQIFLPRISALIHF